MTTDTSPSGIPTPLDYREIRINVDIHRRLTVAKAAAGLKQKKFVSFGNLVEQLLDLAEEQGLFALENDRPR